MRSSASSRLSRSGLTAVTSPTKPSCGSRASALMSPASSPGHADGQRGVDVDGRDDVPVDLADEHHAGDVEGLGVGDPQPVDELGDLAEPGHELADLGAAAVHHEGAHADRAHEHDVGGERGQAGVAGLPPRPGRSADLATRPARNRLSARPGQGVAAVLDHHHLAPERGGCTGRASTRMAALVGRRRRRRRPAVTGTARPRAGRPSRAGRGPGWRTGWPGRPRPWSGCRWRRWPRSSRCGGRSGP